MKIALIGYGKMGQAIESLALAAGHEIVLTINSKNEHLLQSPLLKTCDVAIEFSNADFAVRNILACFDAGLPVVCGSTGWLQDIAKLEKVRQEKNAGFFYASNFSVGVHMFFELNKRLAAMMATQTGYQVQMKEIHHTAKKDAPSGTAISLANDIIQQIPQKRSWVNHASEQAEEISIISERVDPAPGTHIVQYQSEVDEIEIIHTAHSRKGFAAGALQAAEFICGKTGVFSMQDMLILP